MRVFVAGAGGAVGRYLVPLLVERGHAVTATTKSAARADALQRMGAEVEILDGLDAAAVGQAVARARPEAIVHEMTALAGASDLRRFDRAFATTNRLRTEGTANLLAAARATGVRRFVAQSYTGWNNARTGGSVTTEDDPFDADPLPEQSETLAAIVALERAVLEAPLEGVVLRYGSLYGPGASDAIVELVRRRRLPLIGDGGGVWSWLHVADAAGATATALEHGAPDVYNVVDDEPAPVSEWLPYLAEILGAKPPLRVPAWLGRIAAGRVIVRMMTEIRGASNAKARHALGWRPAWRSWRDGFRYGLIERAAAPAPGESRAA
jgi:nucleoside-diphosphate-sugar epimerase